MFDVGRPPQIRLVDMPGYGFADAPKDMVKRWRYLVNDYLRGRAVLRRALVLVDCRHGLKEVDREVMDMLDAAAVSYHLVLTKADKVKPTGLGRDAGRRPPPKRPSIPPRTPPSSRRRAKPVAGSPSCGLQSSKRPRPRESHLLKLIIGNRAYSSWSMRGWLAVKQSGEQFEELCRAVVRRRMGKAPRRRRIRPLAGQGADPVGRRMRRLGQPGDHRVPRRPRRPRHLLAERRNGARASPARCRRRCTRASPICGANCR